jgi:hypothetical protein
MGLWAVLLDIVKTAATHAAPHVARSAVDMARERMNANRVEPQDAEALEQLKQLFSEFDQRIATAEERAAAAEERLSQWQQNWDRKWASARMWVLALLVWNALLTGLAIYLAVARH